MDEDRELRDAFAAVARTAAPHLDDGDWERLAAGEMSAAERERALDHITRCAACAPLCQGLLMIEEGARGVDPGVPRAGLARPARRARAAAWMTAGAALAAAAAWFGLALGPVGVPPARQAREPFRSEAGAQPVLLAPIGTLAAPPREFRWKPFPGAAAYRVDLVDANAEPLWDSGRLAQTQVPWPATVQARPGRYHWMVTALADGSEADAVRSPLVAFEILPAP